MSHDPVACGIVKVTEDSNGIQTVRTGFCTHGRSVAAVRTHAIGPEMPVGVKNPHNKPLCGICHEPMFRPETGRKYKGKKSHPNCIRALPKGRPLGRPPQTGPAPWKFEFLKDWNDGVPTPTLIARYHRGASVLRSIAAKLRRAGHVLVKRPNRAWGHAFTPTEGQRQTHAAALASAYRRSQFV